MLSPLWILVLLGLLSSHIVYAANTTQTLTTGTTLQPTITISASDYRRITCSTGVAADCVLQCNTGNTNPIANIQGILEITNVTVTGCTEQYTFIVENSGTLIMRNVIITSASSSSAGFIKTQTTELASVYISNAFISGKTGHSTIRNFGPTHVEATNIVSQNNTESFLRSINTYSLTAIISNCRFQNSSSPTSVGSVITIDNSTVDITITGTVFENHSSTPIMCSSSSASTTVKTTLTISSSTSNRVTGGDGAFLRIEKIPFQLTITDSSFSSQTSARGGTLSVASVTQASNVTITSSNFTNSASSRGGALHYTFSNLAVSFDRVRVTGITTAFEGFAISGYLGVSGSLNLQNSYFASGKATYGSAVAVSGTISSSSLTSVTIRNCKFQDSDFTPVGTGGAVLFNQANVTGQVLIEDSLFSNLTGVNGAGLTFIGATFPDVTIRGTLLEKNLATFGSGVRIVDSTVQLTLENTQFRENSASKEGGGLGAADSNLYITLGAGVVFQDNAAATLGGAIFIDSTLTNTPITISGLTFTGNSAFKGGALAVQNIPSGFQLLNSTFLSNDAGQEGGAVYLANIVNPILNGLNFNGNLATTSPALSSVALTHLQLMNSKFQANEGSNGAIGFTAHSGVTEVQNLEIFENRGGAFSFSGSFDSEIQISSSQIYDNYDDDVDFVGGGTIISTPTFSGAIVISTSTFTSNQIPSGALVNLEGGNLTFMGCQFQANNGSIISSSNLSKSKFTNCIVSGNGALSGDSTSSRLFSTQDASTLELSSSLFQGNQVGTLLFFKSSNPSVATNCTLAENPSQENLIVVQEGHFTLQDSTISQGPALSPGSCLKVFGSGTLTVQGSFIEACNSDSAPAILDARESATVFLSSFTIKNVSTSIGPVLQFQDKAKLQASDVTISQIIGGIYYGVGRASAVFEASQFQDSSSSYEASFFQVSRGSSLTLRSCQISRGNSSSSGCIMVDSASLTFEGGMISSCSTLREGASLSIFGASTVLVRDVYFHNNTADQGGALSFLRTVQASMLFQGCIFEGNKASNGGVLTSIIDSESSATFQDCTFRKNSAQKFGGIFITADSTKLTFLNSTFEENQASSAAVGYIDWSSDITVTNCTIKNNLATSNAGAFFLDKSASCTLSASEVDGNAASLGSGGVFFLQSESSLVILDSQLKSNQAHIHGGVIGVASPNGCSISIAGSGFFHNSAGQRGGCISFSQATSQSLTISGSSMTFNSASNGGCLSVEGFHTFPILNQTTIENNQASVFGKDIFTPPSYLTTSLTPVAIEPGKTLPAFTVFLFDSNSDLYTTSLIQPFQVTLGIKSPGYLKGIVSALISNGTVTFSNPTDGVPVGVYAAPGNHSLTIGPSEFDQYYPASFTILVNITLTDCPSGKLGLDLACVTCSQGCVNGDCNQTNICTCHEGYQGPTCEMTIKKIDPVPIIAISSVIAFLFLVWAVLHRFFPRAHNIAIFTVFLPLFDFVTDCLFAYNQRDNPQTGVFATSIVFIAVPCIFSLLTLINILIFEILRDQRVETWVMENYVLVAGMIILSTTNMEAFTLLTSNLFYFQIFNAPISPRGIRILEMCGLIGNCLEDIPQLALQIIVARENEFDTITILSLIASTLTITFGILKRGILILIVRFGSHKRESKASEFVTHTELPMIEKKAPVF